MTCNTCMNKLMSLDNGERMSIPMAFHLSRCPDCMKAAAEMNATLTGMSMMTECHDPDITESVMILVEKGSDSPKLRAGVSMRIWVLVGLGILAVMSFSAFAEPFISAELLSGDLFLNP